MLFKLLTFCIFLLSGADIPALHAEPFVVPYMVSSGPVTSSSASSDLSTIYSTLIRVPRSHSLRLHYGVVRLEGPGTILRITSLQDGATQIQNQDQISEWSGTSAYFNGDAVSVEILSFPGTGYSQFNLKSVEIDLLEENGQPSISGPRDSRVPSSDARVGRMMPVGCTAWLVETCGQCLLTAGHCFTALDGVPVIEFRVPLSDFNGFLRHPDPRDQYAVDPVSVQSRDEGPGNDWGFFGVHRNPVTGKSPGEAIGGTGFRFGPAGGPQGDEVITLRVTGYGVVYDPLLPRWNQSQKTDTGPFVALLGTDLMHRVDTTGGNSGSPIIDEGTGTAIGIHTHGGADPSGLGCNHGTSVYCRSLLSAILDPKGVCTPKSKRTKEL